MSKKPMGPVVFDLDQTDPDTATTSDPEPTQKPKRGPKSKRPPPKVEAVQDPIDPSSAPMILDDQEPPKGAAMIAATRVITTRFSWITRLFWTALVALFLMYITTAAWDFGQSLVERNLWLGRLAIGLAIIVGLTLLLTAFQEFAGFARLSRLDGFRRKAEALRAIPNDKEAKKYAKNLSHLYQNRPDMKWAIENLAKQDDTVIDPGDILDLTEIELMAPLDKAARKEIETSARAVAGATAIIPLALADVAVALTANTRMVRRIAEIYGGRAGFLGSWRLLRAVATHLIATGAVGVADDLIGTVAGGGLAAKLSRRFGEGIINGALTARVGLAAMDVCRPMPFKARKRPGVTSIVQTALTGMFGKK